MTVKKARKPSAPKKATPPKPNAAELFDAHLDAVAAAEKPVAMPDPPEVNPDTVTIGELATMKAHRDSAVLAAHQQRLQMIERAEGVASDALSGMAEVVSSAQKDLSAAEGEIEAALNKIGITRDSIINPKAPASTKQVMWKRRIMESPQWKDAEQKLTDSKKNRDLIREDLQKLEGLKGETRLEIRRIINPYLSPADSAVPSGKPDTVGFRPK